MSTLSTLMQYSTEKTVLGPLSKPLYIYDSQKAKMARDHVLTKFRNGENNIPVQQVQNLCGLEQFRLEAFKTNAGYYFLFPSIFNQVRWQ